MIYPTYHEPAEAQAGLTRLHQFGIVDYARQTRLRQMGGKKKVLYDVSMAEKLYTAPPSLDKLTGMYVNEDDKTITCEFFIHNDRLWYNAVFGKKLDPFGRILEYVGNNTFQSPNSPPVFHTYFFQINESHPVKCTETFINSSGKKFVLDFIKEK